MSTTENTDLQKFFDISEPAFEFVKWEALEELGKSKLGRTSSIDVSEISFFSDQVQFTAHDAAGCSCCPPEWLGSVSIEHDDILKFAEGNDNLKCSMGDLSYFLLYSESVIDAATDLADKMAEIKGHDGSALVDEIEDGLITFEIKKTYSDGEEHILGNQSISIEDLSNKEKALEVHQAMAIAAREEEAKKQAERDEAIAAEEKEKRRTTLLKLAAEFSNEYTLVSNQTGKPAI